MLLMGLTISSQPKNCFHLRLLGVDKIVAFGLSEHIIDSLIRVGTKRRAHPCISLDKLISYQRIRRNGDLGPTLRQKACYVEQGPFLHFLKHTEWYPSPFRWEVRLHVQGKWREL